MKISIVIPVYNEAETLMACLESIAHQTLTPQEVIVVDNNSTDQTVAVASGFNFVTVVHEPTQGVVHARNRGFDVAQADIIGRIDADTMLPSNWVENVLSIYRDAGAPRLFAATATSQFRNFPVSFWSFMQKLTYFWPARVLLGHTTLVGSDMFLTRSLWSAVRSDSCARNDIHEDMDLALHIGKLGVPIVLRPELQASVVARKVHRRIVSYPLMQLKTRFVSH